MKNKTKEIEKLLNLLTDKHIGNCVMDFLEDEKEKQWWIDKGISENDLKDLMLSVSVFVATKLMREARKKVGYNKSNNRIMTNKTKEQLKEYYDAYYCLLQYWESFGKEQQKEINKALNNIFKLNKGEQVEE